MGRHHYSDREASRDLVPREARKYIYNVALSVLAILGFFGIISEELMPLIISLVGNILAVAVARTHLTPEGEA